MKELFVNSKNMLGFIFVGISVGLTGCATTSPEMKSTTSSIQANQMSAANQTNADNPESDLAAAGPATIQEENTTLPSTSDSDIGGTSIGGVVEAQMDEADKSKMLHAMDKAPGKSTRWTNANTKIKYAVTPTKKVRIEDKNYCRQYQIIAIYANDKEQSVQGVACIASDGNWHILQT